MFVCGGETVLRLSQTFIRQGVSSSDGGLCPLPKWCECWDNEQREEIRYTHLGDVCMNMVQGVVPFNRAFHMLN